MLKSSVTFCFAATCFMTTSTFTFAAEQAAWEVFNKPGEIIESRNCPTDDLIASCFGAYCKDGVVTTFVTNLGFKHEAARDADLGPVTITLTVSDKPIGTFPAIRFIPEGKGYAQIDFEGSTAESIRKSWKKLGGPLKAALPNGLSTEFSALYADFSLRQTEINCS